MQVRGILRSEGKRRLYICPTGTPLKNTILRFLCLEVSRDSKAGKMTGNESKTQKKEKNFKYVTQRVSAQK